ncbi:DUF58 domain-containing protein [Alkalihalobacillus oceani]|uniref:DUF58 domain-containing protein n=1 Tax=Halalkalibacter oceani TaxID=1653776 RepID=UPI002041A1BC|nr:DUF58 domain-containing protein [Halalkalibacter oceani]MCM3763139.1 DUF58 domain-containing protein [Halalkalibacter oceani]
MSQTERADVTPPAEEEEFSVKETSILFEAKAIWVLLALLVVAIWFRFLPLIAVSTFLLLLSFCIVWWKKKALTGLEPQLVLSKSRVFAGEEFHIDATLTNNKWLPLVWLEYELANSTLVSWGEQKRTYVVRFLWLLWYQRIDWIIEGEARRRGVYQFQDVTLRSGDGFRFSEQEKSFPVGQVLFIYPALRSVRPPAFRPSLQWGMNGKQGGFLEDPLLIAGIRDYEPGDEWRKFNWKASARTGKMQSNIYQPVVTQQLMIAIDVQAFLVQEDAYEDPNEQKKYEMQKQEAFENYLSVIASFAAVYEQQGIMIGFITNALDYKGQPLASIQPNGQLATFLDQMAKMEARIKMKKKEFLQMLRYELPRSVPLFLFCGTLTKDHYQWYEQEKNRLADVQFFYSKESEYSHRLSRLARPLDDFVQQPVRKGRS